MDVSDPAAGLVSGLTMPILRAFAGRNSPATAAQIHRVTRRGTEAGVRRAIDRLALHGLLLSEQAGDRRVYSLNREHVLYPAVMALLRADDELPQRLRKEISGWHVPPAAAVMYGSAARRDGGPDSDIDLLLVRPPGFGPQQRELWSTQVHQLRDLVKRWTGNWCQITDRSVPSIKRLAHAHEPIIDEWREDAIKLAGADINQLVGKP